MPYYPKNLTCQSKNDAKYEHLRHFYSVCVRWECIGNGKKFEYCVESKEDPLYEKEYQNCGPSSGQI